MEPIPVAIEVGIIWSINLEVYVGYASSIDLDYMILASTSMLMSINHTRCRYRQGLINVSPFWTNAKCAVVITGQSLRTSAPRGGGSSLCGQGRRGDN